MKDYYAILEINENASRETIEKVHKLLVKKYHPDLQEQSKKAEYEEKMKEVNEAYEILTDSVKKKEYDEQLKEYRMQQIMEQIREEQSREQAIEHQEEIVQTKNTEVPIEQQNYQTSPYNISDDEIRRQAQVYYDELYRQYLYHNGYIKEDFKTVAKRYTIGILTIILLVRSTICFIQNTIF